MLGSLRTFVGSWVAKVLLVLLVGSFALWGIEGGMFGGSHSQAVATVGETTVNANEFVSTYNQSLNQMQRQLGRRLTRDAARTLGIERRALGQLVAWATLDEYARRNGLSLSEDTLAQMIAENPAFQDSSGAFNRDIFTRATYQAQMRESDFIKMQNASAIRNQLTQAFATGPILPDVFENALARYSEEERRFHWIRITPDMAGTLPEPSDDDLATYFEANKTSYRAPEYRAITLLTLEPETIADPSTISDEQVKADYDSRIDTYAQPEKRRVQQIVFASQEKADEAVKTLQEGGIFESVLSNNDVQISDADLGLQAQSQLPSAIAEPAFGLPLNETSDIIDGPFGPTMIRVTEIEAANTTPLEVVADDIRKDLSLRQAADTIISLQETIDDRRAGGVALSDIADELGYKARLIEAVDRSGQDASETAIEDLPSSSNLLREVFRSTIGDQPAPIDVGQAGYVWYELTGITEARDRALDEVRERVAQDWKAAEASKMVLAKTEDLKARLEQGETVQAIAAELEAEMQTTALLKRTGRVAGFPNDGVSQGFAGDDGHVAIINPNTGGDKILLKVAEVKLPSGTDAQLSDELKALSNDGAAEDILSQLISNLQSEYSVTQNPALIDQVLARGQ
ncbi:MAG: SurA N-terminal domain-containing protein [Ahrensia sp.]|nr:SurA N-terminal domain-containing protein [Ahrensia sp.]